MEMLQGVWKQHLRPRAVVGYGLKIFLPSPPNYVTRSPGTVAGMIELYEQLLPTKVYTTQKTKTTQGDVSCRLCGKEAETLPHLL